jgi:hypothetical protein
MQQKKEVEHLGWILCFEGSIVSLNGIKLLVCVNETVCLLRGTKWKFQYNWSYDGLVFKQLKGDLIAGEIKERTTNKFYTEKK